MWTEVVEPFIKAHRKLKLPLGSKGKDLYRSECLVKEHMNGYLP